MMSQVKRKQKLLLALTLTVLITGSILAFSIQEAYSAKNFNSSKSNTSTAISIVKADLLDLKSNFELILGDNNVESYIDNTLVWLDKAEMGVNEMSEFFFVMSVEYESLKQTAESTVTISDPEAVDGALEAESTASELQKLQSENESLRSEKNSLDTELQQLKQQLQSESESTTDADKAIDSIPAGKTGISLPEWTKTNAGWWADGLISDDDYVIGLEWMIKNGIIRI